MLFRARQLHGIATGAITVAFRRWRRPTVKAGGRLRLAVGTLAIDSVERIEEGDITAADAGRSGYGSREELLADLSRSGDLYRIDFRRIGTDDRIELRERIPGAEERDEVVGRVTKLPWAIPCLRAIAEAPGVRAADLATRLGLETLTFKRRVRVLKNLGLTESLETGYRLSPRGTAVLQAVETTRETR